MLGSLIPNCLGEDLANLGPPRTNAEHEDAKSDG